MELFFQINQLQCGLGAKELRETKDKLLVQTADMLQVGAWEVPTSHATNIVMSLKINSCAFYFIFHTDFTVYG